MDVKTQTFYEVEQKLRYAEDEIRRLKERVAQLEMLLNLEMDGEALTGVSNGEVLDVDA